MVGVEKSEFQPPGELSPDGGFTGAGEADEGDQGVSIRQVFSQKETMTSDFGSIGIPRAYCTVTLIATSLPAESRTVTVAEPATGPPFIVSVPELIDTATTLLDEVTTL